MNRDEKAVAVKDIAERLERSQAVFAVDYRGISVTQVTELRTKLRDSDATFKVVKNRLAKRAAADAGTEGLDEILVGPIALTFVEGDPVTAAKVISDFARDNDDLISYVGGIMDGGSLDPDGFKAISRLPGIDVLRGQLVGLAASPLTGLVRGLGAMMSGLAVALGQIQEQGLVGQGTSADEPAKPAADEAPAEEPVAAEEPAADETPAEETAAEEPAAEEAAAEPADQDAEPPVQPEAADEPAEGDVEVIDAELEAQSTSEPEAAAEPADEPADDGDDADAASDETESDDSDGESEAAADDTADEQED